LPRKKYNLKGKGMLSEETKYISINEKTLWNI
jgi:hypothetical protein